MARHAMTRADRRNAAADDISVRVPAPRTAAQGMSAQFFLRASASEMSVRALLAGMRARLRAHGLPETACGTVEIVLAEALNNIVEHAYDGTDGGEIAVQAVLGSDGLTVTLSDHGAALPAQGLPSGRLPELGTGTAALPEGGFGWFLIRSLTREVHHAREAGTNRLILRFDLTVSGDEDR